MPLWCAFNPVHLFAFIFHLGIPSYECCQIRCGKFVSKQATVRRLADVGPFVAHPTEIRFIDHSNRVPLELTCTCKQLQNHIPTLPMSNWISRRHMVRWSADECGDNLDNALKFGCLISLDQGSGETISSIQWGISCLVLPHPSISFHFLTCFYKFIKE